MNCGLPGQIGDQGAKEESDENVAVRGIRGHDETPWLGLRYFKQRKSHRVRLGYFYFRRLLSGK